jgi:hypothetical protein
MRKQWVFLAIFATFAAGGAGCGDDRGDSGPRDMGVLIDIGMPDLGPGDGGMMVDMGRVDGGTRCAVGPRCRPETGCGPGGFQCQTELNFTIGGPSDPIYLPDGGTTSIEGAYWKGNFCTNASNADTGFVVGMPGSCNPDNASDDPAMAGMDGCPACAKCISLGTDRMGREFAQCYPRCTPSATGNPCDRDGDPATYDGWTCDLTQRVCIFGCGSDAECQLYREDTNMNGQLDEEAPDGGAPPDRQRLDVAGGATCNQMTGRCTQPGRPDARAGDTCTRNSDCFMDGRCLDELRFDAFTGGYCTKFGCDVTGCPAGDKCLDLGGGTFACTKPCTVANDPSDATTGRGRFDNECGRAGLACFWDGMSATGAGGCFPGEYNDVSTNNVGEACRDPDGTGPLTASDQCYSPYGLGRCIFSAEIASCSILSCAILPDDACGTGNTCLPISASTSICVKSCAAPADCPVPSYGCVDLDTTGPLGTVCFPGCLTNADCRTGYRCMGATPTALGECVLTP